MALNPYACLSHGTPVSWLLLPIVVKAGPGATAPSPYSSAWKSIFWAYETRPPEVCLIITVPSLAGFCTGLNSMVFFGIRRFLLIRLVRTHSLLKVLRYFLLEW